MHIVLVQLFVSCQASCVNNITTRNIASSSDAVYTLTRHDTNTCTNTFINTMHLSNIFMWQKMVILLVFTNIPPFLTKIF